MVSKKYIDPEAANEAKKYHTPVPSRTFLLNYLQTTGKPISIQTFIQELGLKKASEKEGIKRRLKAMIRDGELMLDRKKRYCLIDKLQLIKGKIQGHVDGFGFLVPEGGGDDYYLSPKQMKMVMPGDIVLARPLTFTKRRSEAVIREVVEKNTKIVGKVQKSGDLLFIKPENPAINHSIFLLQADRKKVEVGQIVVAQLLTHPSTDPQVFAKVKQILGSYMDPGLEIEVALQNYDIPYQWPISVLKEEKACHKAMHHAPSHWLDLTNLPFVTIDGEDAKDFDDAVYCERKSGGGWYLYVAIAHVSYFVVPESVLDKEAETRGNSVYFPSQVVPMLPEFLSNELCSLKPLVKRAALVCKMLISEKGILNKFEFFEAWIESKARLTYTEVSDFYQNKNKEMEASDLAPHLNELRAVYNKLRKQREKRGALDLEISETRIKFGEDKKIEKIILVERKDSHKLIEECMIIANVATARFLKKEQLTALYRNHTKPKSQKLHDLVLQLSLKGIKFPVKRDYTTKDLSAITRQTQKRPDSALLQTLILRSLQTADYGPKCLGHYGLALPAYTHFTSPIRRYPDLLVHRVICQHLHKKGPEHQVDYEQLKKIGEHCSMTERRADEAVWDVMDWLKCEYMLERVGQTYEGTVTSVTDFGLFVMLKGLLVEGLVHVTALQNDYYRFDSSHLALRGERTGLIYRMGDDLKVIVSRVNLDEKKIDFVLA